MILSEFEYRSRHWEACLQPVLDPAVETGLEVVFVPHRGARKYACPVDGLLLRALVEEAVPLDAHRLRRMLQDAMEIERPPAVAREGERAGVLSRVHGFLSGLQEEGEDAG